MRRTSSTRELMPSFRKICLRWNATVCVLTYIWSAACWLLSPWATRMDVIRSVSVRLAQPAAGRPADIQCRRRMPSLRSRRRTRARSLAAPTSPYPPRASSRCATASPGLVVAARTVPRSSDAEARAQGSGCVAAACASRTGSWPTMPPQCAAATVMTSNAGLSRASSSATRATPVASSWRPAAECGAHQPGRCGWLADQDVPMSGKAA